ncbi:MAG: response regulator [Bryobacterales bacterium]|nr:response regulator [Bryobacterales bacterium]
MNEATGILVVEDDPSIATVLEEILAGKQYEVRVANSPNEAIEAIGDKVPSLVLMDVNLGSDIDGIETVRRLRDDYEDLPVCFITAYSDDATMARAEEVGPMAYLVKPFEMADVLTMVSISLASARRMRERLKKALQSQPAVPPPAAPPAPAAAAPPPPPPSTEHLEDKLTGLPNRRAIEHLIKSRCEEPHFFVALLAVDHIPILRQRFGGAALDQILFSYSQHLGQHLPEQCMLARWDTTHFVVMPREAGHDAQREASRIVSAPMLYHLRLPGRSALLRVTAGFKVFTGSDAEIMVEQVESAVTSHR